MKLSSKDIALQFKSFSFFESFSEELLENLSSLAQLKSFKPGEIILKEGDDNNKLFFLKSGEVKVIVDNEIVALLNNIGEVMGEMSVITGRSVAATIKAHSVVDVLILDALDFTKVNHKEFDQFQALLFRIYAMVLSERLIKTNEKAKKFELITRELERTQKELTETNKNLELQVQKRTQELVRRTDELIQSKSQLESQHVALLAGFKKVADLAQIKLTTLEKIKNLSSNYLSPFKNKLVEIYDQTEGSSQEEIQKAINQLDNVINFIKPLTELQKSDKGMESKKVLLADEEKKNQLVAKMALVGTGLTLDIASDFATASEMIEKNQYDLIFCEVGLGRLLDKVEELHRHCQIVLMTSHDILSSLDYLKRYKNVNNVVSRNLEDRTFTVKNIVATATKVLNEDYFGLEKYLAWGVDVQERAVMLSSERGTLNEEMCAFFKKMGIRESILSRCQVIVEELLMNAIYDAPQDASGNALYNHLDRTLPIQLKKEHAAYLRYACDGNFIAISVSDPFGALSKDIIISYLDSCYSGNAGSLNSKKGGAGRGIHQIVESSDLTVFNVKKSIKTEVVVIINIDSSALKKTTQPTLHYFFS